MASSFSLEVSWEMCRVWGGLAQKGRAKGSLSGPRHYHVDAPRGEFSFDIPNPKLLSCQHAPQYGIHVAKRESTDKQVCLFPGTELRLSLDFVPEVPAVGSAQDGHALGVPRSFEYPVPTGSRDGLLGV